MEVYRIVQDKYAHDLSGNGARLFGARWNNEGRFALYTAESRSLALLETLAHTSIKLLNEKTYHLITIWVPGEAIFTINAEALPAGWNAPIAMESTKMIGEEILKGNDTFLLKVPSVMMVEESNYIINPGHPLFKKVKITRERRVHFDSRVIATPGPDIIRSH
jgi:RES domain-containing protein